MRGRMPDQAWKQCTHCRQTRPVYDFYVRRNGGDGYRNQCKDCMNLRMAKRRLHNKETVINHYGGQCACCGVQDLVFLAIDHIEEDGAEHRRKIGRSPGQGFYSWLVQNDFPSGFQALCHNCNWAKYMGGCPHNG